MSNYYKYLLISILATAVWSLQSCQDQAQGEQLAKTYCSSCHLYPEPGLLPQNVWLHGTLPYMSIYMGVESEIAKLKAPFTENLLFRPTQAMISDSDWQKIKTFYLDNAPKQLPTNEQPVLENLTGVFEIIPASLPRTGINLPNFACVRIESAQRRIWASDEVNHVLWLLDPNGKPLGQTPNQASVTHVDFGPEGALLTNMGQTSKPTTQLEGSALRVAVQNGLLTNAQQVLTQLNRPAQVQQANLDTDADAELVVCEFGFKDGKLSVRNPSPSGTYQETTLSQVAGATNAVVTDFDGDKRLDIIVLFSQGDERIVWYRNKGQLQFEEKVLLRFPPIYGSSHVEVADFNQDQRPDLLYTAGDNADFSTVLKPYHGVYVFENQGNGQFKQTYFFPQNGAYKALARDFDADGDLDIASISFFADEASRPQESFIYLENTGRGTFQPKTLSINHLGRWNVMDADDADGDGDVDIVLGSHPVAPIPTSFNKAWATGTGVLILRNATKQ